MDDLVKRLRAINKNYDLARGIHCDIREAADRIQALEARIAKADALAYRMDQVLTDLTKHGGYTYEDDFPNELAVLAAYREGSDT